MTGLIGSLVGVASTAVERLAGTLTPKGEGTGAGQGHNPVGEFAALLATMNGASAARGQGAGQRGAVAQTTQTATGESEADGALAGAAAVATKAVEGAAGEVEGEGATLAGVAEEEALEEGEAEARLAGAEDPAPVTASAADIEVRRVDRNLDRLQPEFRERLDRVVERMQAEFGHKVTVVEAHRSEARQNFLYEQGRSRPGQVVTWTRNSNHTTGRAVDVMIDGTYNNALGYQRLAKIAAEEGLKTLGPKDPGHVELPRGVPGGGPGQYADPARGLQPNLEPVTIPNRVGGLAQVAEVARVAEVAQVARVADVAQVAEVARVADPTRPAVIQTAPTTAPSAESAAAILAASAGGAGGGQGGSSGRREGQDPTTTTTAEMELLRADPGLGRALGGGSFGEAQMTAGTDAVQRAAQILAMKESASNAPVNHLLLRIDSPGGGEDRIRVDLRGGTVGATLDIENAAEAERLNSRAGELRQSLERLGLEAEAVRIRSNSTISTDRIEVTRAALTAAELEAGRSGGQSRSGSDSSSQQRDVWKEAHEQQRRDPNDPRNRSRKEPQKEGSA